MDLTERQPIFIGCKLDGPMRRQLETPTRMPFSRASSPNFAHYQTNAKHLAPVLVDNGSVFENIVTKDDIDIEKFPTPVWHRDDGGRYIGTGCYSVTMDPDEKWFNAGCYRAMIQDRNR